MAAARRGPAELGLGALPSDHGRSARGHSVRRAAPCPVPALAHRGRGVRWRAPAPGLTGAGNPRSRNRTTACGPWPGASLTELVQVTAGCAVRAASVAVPARTTDQVRTTLGGQARPERGRAAEPDARRARPSGHASQKTPHRSVRLRRHDRGPLSWRSRHAGSPARHPAAGRAAIRHAHPPRPGTAVAVTFSRAPRSGTLTPTPEQPSRHRRITAGRSGQVTVTRSDDGATVVLVPGQVITVVLAGQGMLLWNRPRLARSVAGVLRQLSASGGYPSEAPARASYRAVRVGPAEIISGTNARCLHTQPPCEIAQRLWRVTVVVH